jgi:hypothetical protein
VADRSAGAGGLGGGGGGVVGALGVTRPGWRRARALSSPAVTSARSSAGMPTKVKVRGDGVFQFIELVPHLCPTGVSALPLRTAVVAGLICQDRDLVLSDVLLTE